MCVCVCVWLAELQQYALSVNGDLGLGRHFAWTIIGADILRLFGLLIDLGRTRLMDANTFYTVPVSYKQSSVSKLCALVEADSYSAIFNEFHEVTVGARVATIKH